MKKYFRGLFNQNQETPSDKSSDPPQVSSASFEKFKASLTAQEVLDPFADVSLTEASNFMKEMIKEFPFMKDSIAQTARQSIAGIDVENLNKVYAALEPLAQDIGLAVAKIFKSAEKVQKDCQEVKDFQSPDGVPLTLETWVSGRLLEFAIAYCFFIQRKDLTNNPKVIEFYRKKGVEIKASLNGKDIDPNSSMIAMMLTKSVSSLFFQSIQFITQSIIAEDLKKIVKR